MNIQIVTDSSAHFAVPHFLHQHPMVTVVPNRISIAGKSYREGLDITSEDALRLMSAQPYAPVVNPPTEAEFVETYRKAAANGDAIISIHASREISRSYENALAATRQLSALCPIAVIDSQNIDAGQGMLVKAASRIIKLNLNLDDMVRLIRGTIERIYSIYYTESVTYLQQNRIMTDSHTILSSLLGIKPVLGVEHGRMIVTEKVKTRAQAVERLLEFVVEFAEIEDVVILQHKAYTSDQTRMMQDRLTIDYPNQFFPYAIYTPSLAALIGPDASGLVVLEKEMDGDSDEF